MARPLPHKRVARAAAVSILTFAAVIAVLWSAPRVSGAVAEWLRTPQVRAVTLQVAGGLTLEPATASARAAAPGSRAGQDGGVTPAGAVAPSVDGDPAAAARASSATLDAGLRFTMLGVTCAVPEHAYGVLVDLRTSLDGSAWSRWYTTSLDVQADGRSRTPQAFTEALWTGPGRFVQVAARPADGSAAPAALRDVRVVAIDSNEQADAGAVVLGVLRRALATIAGFEFTPQAAAMTDKPAIVTRQEWGADESYRTGTPDYATPLMVFVHHTDSGNDYKRDEAASIVRGVYYYHTRSLHWSDVGYNFLIDRYGTVYEGRYGGVTKGVIGAQVLGFNTGSVGVSVMGTYSKTTPTAASVRALEGLLAWKLDVHHIDPLGRATLTCGYGEKFSTGEKVEFAAISGHRDANYTECPGNKLYPLLAGIRKTVDVTGQPKIYGAVVDELSISPGGDGVRDGATLTARLSDQADWKLEVRDAEGTLQRSVSGSGTAVQTTWSGRDNDGRLVPDGDYALTLSAGNAHGAARPASVTVRVDTAPPQVQSAAVDPDTFSPNGDGQDDTATVSFRPGESGTARVTVLDAKDRVVRTVLPWSSVGAARKTVSWDGRVNENGKLVDAPEGKAAIVVELRDPAGNSASVRRSVTVDRTLGYPVVKPSAFSPNGDGVKDAASLAFKLTRSADVKIRVLAGEESVRVMDLGALAAGDRNADWDGLGPGGAPLASGSYRLKVVADGDRGVSSVSVPVTVDLTAPRLTVPATLSVKKGRTAKVSFTVRDAYSATVNVNVTVADGDGAHVATLSPGWVKQGTPATCSWKPPAAGAYTLTFSAADRSGNPQAAPGVTRLTVR
jgi:flagellar hook assembly protein FlgD